MKKAEFGGRMNRFKFRVFRTLLGLSVLGISALPVFQAFPAFGDDLIEFHLTIEGERFVVRLHRSQAPGGYVSNIFMSEQRGNRGLWETPNGAGDAVTRYSYEAPPGQTPSRAINTFLEASLVQMVRSQSSTSIILPPVKNVPPGHIAALFKEQLSFSAVFTKIFFKGAPHAETFELGIVVRDPAVFSELEKILEQMPSSVRHSSSRALTVASSMENPRAETEGARETLEELEALRSTYQNSYRSHARRTMRLLVDHIVQKAIGKYGAAAPEPWASTLISDGVERDAFNEIRFNQLLGMHLSMVLGSWSPKNDPVSGLVLLFTKKNGCSDPLSQKATAS